MGKDEAVMQDLRVRARTLAALAEMMDVKCAVVMSFDGEQGPVVMLETSATDEQAGSLLLRAVAMLRQRVEMVKRGAARRAGSS